MSSEGSRLIFFLALPFLDTQRLPLGPQPAEGTGEKRIMWEGFTGQTLCPCTSGWNLVLCSILLEGGWAVQAGLDPRGLLCCGLLTLHGTCKLSKYLLKCDLTLSFASSEKER